MNGHCSTAFDRRNPGWSPGPGEAAAPETSGAAVILAVARRMAAAAEDARQDGFSYETMRWLFTLSRHPAFLPPGAAPPASTDALAGRLGLLLTMAGDEPIAALLLGALQIMPVDGADRPRGPDTGGSEHPERAFPSLFAAALAAMLDAPSAAVLPPEATFDVLRALQAADAALQAEAPDAIGLRFLVLAAQLGLALRLAASAAGRARLMLALGALAGRGAGVLAGALADKAAQEERMRAMLNDPAYAMRLHYLVPRRSMTTSDADSVRKQFARDDALAAQAREAFERTTETVTRLREESALLEGLAEMLRTAATATLAGAASRQG